MDTIEFERVTLAEAKQIIKEEKEALKPPAEDWSGRRMPSLPEELQLQQLTREWILGLPDEVRPLRLARQFPRIANKIASVWKTPTACDKVLDGLMIDHRGTRQGFPEAVALEIGRLKSYYSTQVFAERHDTWTLA
ncbi:MAG: hypothetical protein H6R01_1999 [Burkholderiaceae bacterium]|nr:hypothetical protein [Burkholderiaceae bacterium]